MEIVSFDQMVHCYDDIRQVFFSVVKVRKAQIHVYITHLHYCMGVLDASTRSHIYVKQSFEVTTPEIHTWIQS